MGRKFNLSMESLEKHLLMAIKERLEDVAEEELQKAEINIRKRMGEYVAGTVINLMQFVTIDRVGPEIILRIEMPKEG